MSCLRSPTDCVLRCAFESKTFALLVIDTDTRPLIRPRRPRCLLQAAMSWVPEELLKAWHTGDLATKNTAGL